MSEQQPSEALPTHKELANAAIQMALDANWEEAERLNQLILENMPDDVQALSRLGKALSELRRYKEAIGAYERVLELDPYNRIARKNRDRLANLLASAEEQAGIETAGREQIHPDLFISESGKSAVVPLHGVTSRRLLAGLSRGEAVRLETEGQSVLVKTEEGVPLGRLDPRIGRRLAEFIRIGNRYAAAIAEMDDRGVKIFVRETYQHPRLAGRISFPPIGPTTTDTIRPYIRDLGLHLQEAFESSLDEGEEEEEEEEGLEVEEDVDVEDEDLLEEEAEEEDEFEEEI